MKKYGKWIAIIIGILIIASIIIYFAFFSNKNSNISPNGTRISTNIENNNSYNSINESNQITSKEIISATEGLEKEISSFSTKIVYKDDNRDHNIKLSLSKLNGVTVKSGDTFSFNNTVGSPSAEAGYKKADIFVQDKIVKGYGGGNCQVSTTLYNAVLKADGLQVTERHEHTRDVDYIEDGKDAAVAYGEIDLKFKNNSGNDIKIYAEMKDKEVKIKIVQL